MCDQVVINFEPWFHFSTNLAQQFLSKLILFFYSLFCDLCNLSYLPVSHFGACMVLGDSCVKCNITSDGVAVVRFDTPGSKVYCKMVACHIAVLLVE